MKQTATSLELVITGILSKLFIERCEDEGRFGIDM
jgi:hypothetical protein